MRRRTISGKAKPLVLTLSGYSYSATPANGTKGVMAYYGGVPITDLTSSMVSKSGNMSSVSVNSSGVITMHYNWNTSISSSKTSTMTLTYQGKTKTFTITQAKDYETGRTEKTKTQRISYTYSDITLKSLDRAYDQISAGCQRNSHDDEAFAIATDLVKTTTTCYYYQVTYASGNTTNLSCHNTTQSTSNVGTKTVYATASGLSTTYVVGSAYSKICTFKYEGATIATLNISYTPTETRTCSNDTSGYTDCPNRNWLFYKCCLKLRKNLL